MIDFKTKDLKGDLLVDTAGIVALPLALAFGEASGAGPIAGLYGAIFVGFFASLFGGTGSQVTGPTGPMVVVFAGVYATLDGNPSLVFTTVVLAGAIQVALGVLAWPIHPIGTLPSDIGIHEWHRLHNHRASDLSSAWP